MMVLGVEVHDREDGATVKLIDHEKVKKVLVGRSIFYIKYLRRDLAELRAIVHFNLL